MRQLIRRMTAAVPAMVVVVAAVALPASPAAAIPSGAGWSASWNYYTSNSFEVHLTIPGGRVDGHGPDANGVRRFDATVQDTDARDRACVRLRVIATDQGSLGSATACNGATKIVNTGDFAEALFVHIDLMVDGAIAKSFFTFIPSSANDPTLRTAGTGTEWAYTSSTSYHVEVHRHGVQVIGDGSHQDDDTRSLAAAVAHEYVADGCVVGGAADATIFARNWTCEVGNVPAFSSFDFTGYIKVTGCHVPASGATRCLTMHFPEPH